MYSKLSSTGLTRSLEVVMKDPEVYLFGQVLDTHSFLLRGGFLQPDEYSEIDAQYFLPGGETGTAATVLDSLGVSVKMACPTTKQ